MNSANSSLELGCVINRKYMIGSVLGIGGFGMTYLSQNIWTQDIYAIKEYFPGEWAMRAEDTISVKPKDDKKSRFYEHGLEVFINEAKILKGLSEDDVVVNVVDFFYENNTAYIVMEYINGLTLAKYMHNNNQTIALGMAEKIILSVAKSMSKIHSLGLLHRDISPDNIMILPGGDIKLIDFGATRQYILNETTDMSVLIKPGFAPVEQYSRNGKQGPWTDVYALAATYYYILSGKKPLSSMDRCTGEEQTPLYKVNHEVPRRLSDVIEHAMELEYSKRIRSMRDFIYEIEKTHIENGKKHALYVTIRVDRKIRKLKFSTDKILRIGRSDDECDICIKKSEISRIHCEIRYDTGRDKFIVRDYSKNGTYIDEGLIGKGRYALLDSGEMFYLVNSANKFCLEVK